mgnify:CR=1 FL=1
MEKNQISDEPKKKYNKMISRRGYSLIKDKLSSKELKELKKELTVAPISHINYGPSPTPFKIYKESKQKIYVPKSFGLKKFGDPDLNKFTPSGTFISRLDTRLDEHYGGLASGLP